MRPRALAALAAGAVALIGLPSPAQGPDGPDAAQAASCKLILHAKRAARRGTGRKPARLKRWRSCVPISNPQPPTPLGVEAEDDFGGPCGEEMCLEASRSEVPAGAVRVELANQGDDPHTLRIQNAAATTVFAIPGDFSELGPGLTSRRTVALASGTWTLYCSVSDHRARGMEDTLVVN